MAGLPLLPRPLSGGPGPLLPDQIAGVHLAGVPGGRRAELGSRGVHGDVSGPGGRPAGQQFSAGRIANGREVR